METQTTQGIVKSLKKDKKGIRLSDDQWYSNNFKDELNVNVGDEVKVTYKVNGMFKNYETIEVIRKAPQSDTFAKARESKDASQLTSYAKDIVIAAIGNSQMPKEEVKVLMLEAARAVAEAYNQIKEDISGEKKEVKAEKEPEKEPAVVKPGEL